MLWQVTGASASSERVRSEHLRDHQIQQSRMPIYLGAAINPTQYYDYLPYPPSNQCSPKPPYWTSPPQMPTSQSQKHHQASNYSTLRTPVFYTSRKSHAKIDFPWDKLPFQSQRTLWSGMVVSTSRQFPVLLRPFWSCFHFVSTLCVSSRPRRLS